MWCSKTEQSTTTKQLLTDEELTFLYEVYKEEAVSFGLWKRIKSFVSLLMHRVVLITPSPQLDAHKDLEQPQGSAIYPAPKCR